MRIKKQRLSLSGNKSSSEGWSPCGCSKGFTLIEMITVLIIISIIITIGIGGLREIRPEREAAFMVSRVKEDLERTMMMSMRKQWAPGKMSPPTGGFGIHFDLIGNRYHLFADRNNNGVKDLEKPGEPTEEIGLWIKPIGNIKEIQFDGTRITSGTASIIFNIPDPNIIVERDGLPPISINKTIILLESKDGIQREIRINKIGLIEII